MTPPRLTWRQIIKAASSVLGLIAGALTFGWLVGLLRDRKPAVDAVDSARRDTERKREAAAAEAAGKRAAIAADLKAKVETAKATREEQGRKPTTARLNDIARRGRP